jgi:hypothetical protein
VSIRPGGLLSKEVEIRRKELERESVGRKITTLEAKARHLADLIVTTSYGTQVGTEY